METPIGKALISSEHMRWSITTMSIVAVVADMTLVSLAPMAIEWRYALASLLVVWLGATALRSHDRTSFGFVLSPLQGWRYWMKAAVLVGALVLLILAIAAGIAFGVLKYSVPPSRVSHSSQVWPLFVWMCILSPVFEEIIYRLAICVPATALFGSTAAIIVSGVFFAALHVIYGCPSPENLLGGFVLSWAFLKSGTLVMPIALHSLGNFFAFGFQVAYYWLGT